MALSDEIREQREKYLKGKGRKAYLKYFWDYFKIPTFAVIGVGILLGSLIHSRVTYKPSALYALFLNALAYDENRMDEMASEYAQEAEIDLSKNSVMLDTSLYRTPGTNSQSQTDMVVQMKLLTYLGASTLDVIVADAWNYTYYMGLETFMDLRSLFTEEELKQFEGRIYYMDKALFSYDPYAEQSEHSENPDPSGLNSQPEYVSAEDALAFEKLETFELPDPAQMEDPVPAGIFISDWSRLENMYPGTAAILGVAAGTKQADNVKRFLLYLMD